MSTRTFELRQDSLSEPITAPRALRRSARSWLFRLFRRLVLDFVFLTLALVMVYRWLPVPVTPLMMLRMGETLGGGQIQFTKKWVPLTKISPRMQEAVIAAEDMKFYEHHGFDWEAIDQALRHNERSQKVRGASTISQQVAKNVFLWPERSWMRKGLEAYFTALIECFWSKKKIMEVYLNVVELGDGVYGVEAASERYFGKSASHLTASEASLLAAVLPSPRRFSIAHPSAFVRFRQTMIQRRLSIAAEAIP